MYLIENIESDSNYARLWWTSNKIGYTIDVDEAGRFSQAEAARLEQYGIAKMWPESVVLNLSKRVVVK